MKCPHCDLKLKGKKTDYDYSLKTFDGLIVECKKYYCKKCIKEFIDLGDDAELKKQIVESILSQSVLARSQLRYIIEQIFEMSVFQFSGLIKENPSFINDVIKRFRPLSQELSDKIQDQIFIKFKTPTITISASK
jgi:hypothetical protein